jgi:hypothetical protein
MFRFLCLFTEAGIDPVLKSQCAVAIAPAERNSFIAVLDAHRGDPPKSRRLDPQLKLTDQAPV